MATIETNETTDLIASDKVEGTAVYDRQGERLGSIQSVMLGKRDGRIEYAVLTFGGFLGIGNDYYPLPWNMLSYDVDRGGYVVDLDRNRLQDAPRYRAEEAPDYSEDYRTSIYSFYGQTPFA